MKKAISNEAINTIKKLRNILNKIKPLEEKEIG